MGNCQATDVAAVVIQHPGGRVERLYWPTPASEVMRSNPGHYVALITPCRLPNQAPQHQPGEPPAGPAAGEGVRFTRVRLLRPKDTLVLGQVYRLVTSQEVIKGLRARKQEKMRAQMEQFKQQRQYQRMKAPGDEQGLECPVAPEKDAQVGRQERSRHRAAQPAGRPRQWRPSLQSISEVGS
uniref:Regulatory protein pocR n=1 Tax=Anthurium amnicola TaxID=1678845 RepID=A0A1D1XE01_9ARAE